LNKQAALNLTKVRNPTRCPFVDKKILTPEPHGLTEWVSYSFTSNTLCPISRLSSPSSSSVLYSMCRKMTGSLCITSHHTIMSLMNPHTNQTVRLQQHPKQSSLYNKNKTNLFNGP